MRKLIFASLAVFIVAAPIASVVKAEDTTVIKKDDGDTSKTIIKKRDDVNVVPVPHTEEKKTIIKKEAD
jgi:hypothetical protein